jgi:hypothetical protein
VFRNYLLIVAFLYAVAMVLSLMWPSGMGSAEETLGMFDDLMGGFVFLGFVFLVVDGITIAVRRSRRPRRAWWPYLVSLGLVAVASVLYVCDRYSLLPAPVLLPIVLGVAGLAGLAIPLLRKTRAVPATMPGQRVPGGQPARRPESFPPGRPARRPEEAVGRALSPPERTVGPPLSRPEGPVRRPRSRPEDGGPTRPPGRPESPE